MEVVMIRHTSVNVAKGTCYGWTDVPVSDTFEQEASITKSKLDGITFDAVYYSQKCLPSFADMTVLFSTKD